MYQHHLDSLQKFGIHLGLERIGALLARLGNPQRAFPVIHVAGTNGKGSVCAYLSSILHSAGYRVGRYTSPHLTAWNERIWISSPIPDARLEACIARVAAAAAELDPELGRVTQFETFTAAAFLDFAQERIEIGVIEVGLGGRLDATNVFERPLVTAITGIGLDHTEQLGPTTAEIAREKAGILRSGSPLVLAPVDPRAEDTIFQEAARLQVPVTIAHPARWVAEGEAEWQGLRYHLPLAGDVQLQNSATALQICKLLQVQGWKLEPTSLQTGLAETTWPGRYQWLNPGLLVDGAHNPQAAGHLRCYLDRVRPNTPVRWVIGILATKEAEAILAALLRVGDLLIAVPVPEADSYPPDHLVEIASALGVSAQARESWREALPVEGGTTVVCGSLYLVGELLKTIQN